MRDEITYPFFHKFQRLHHWSLEWISNFIPLSQRMKVLIHVGIKVDPCYSSGAPVELAGTVKPVCNDHLYNKIHYLWLIQ